MKFFTVLALAGAASATVVPAVSTGSSAVSSQTDGVGNYAFGYNEDHSTGGTFRKESGGPGYMTGSYGLRDADGRQRVVNYVADALGYRASISSNEPGTDVKQDPAHADFNLGAAAALVAPAAPLAAPVAAPYAVAAPVHAPLAVAPIHATSYSSAVQHVAAPAVYAAKSYVAPVVAAPMAVAPVHATSYSTAVQHVAAPVVQYAAPVLAAKTYVAPAIASPITGFSSGYYAPSVHGYASPVMASKTISSFGKIF